MEKFIKDPISALTHFIGALLSIVGLVFLIYYGVVKGTVWHIVSFSIFGASLILLYSASTIYHSIKASPKVTKILRKIDHMMIYVLIAGTYTPICLVALRGPWGWSLLIGIWTLAILGIFVKAFWLNAPRWVSTSFYLGMGWLVVIAIIPLGKSMPLGAILWLVAGGLLYTLGAVIYGLKWPKINLKYFGFHEIFHLFVMAGSFSHFWLMKGYIAYIG